MGQMAPFYKNQLTKIVPKLSSTIDIILVPLCDESHFNGFVINRRKKSITHVDSLYPKKTGRRSVCAYLKESFFPEEVDT